MTQGQYVAAAYGAVFVFVLVYVVIIAAKLARLQRETAELLELARSRERLDRLPHYAAPVRGSREGATGTE
ncbi:MAG TPA: CcmD family protein [Gaiellaceae bacterium]|nr:CcmD family protein [Gaiellaceae bacterium]